MNCIKLLGAINKNTGKYTPPRFASKNNKYKCPECERDLIFRQGKIKVPHYAHKKENDPCKFYINPTETQIHKDAKLLLKSIIENNINLKIKRNCICCNDTINEYIIPQYNDNFKVCIEYKIIHNNKTKYIDVAYIDKNNNIIALFEICYKNKTCEEDRPDPWYEFNAEKFIDIVNRNTEINELTIECIRKHNCAKCIANINEDNKKHEEAKIKLAKMIPFDKDDSWKNNIFIDYPILNIDEYFQGCLMLDKRISIENVKKYIPEHIYNSIEDHSQNILSNPEIIKYIPRIPQVFDSNFVPSFELCEEIGLYPFMEVDIAIPHKGDIVEVWILVLNNNVDEIVINKLLKYTNNCSIYVINVYWILEQNNNLSQEDLYNNVKKIAQCFIKPIELKKKVVPFDFTNIYLKVPFNQKDEAKDLGAKWDNENKLWYIKNDNKNTKYILTLFNKTFLKLKIIKDTINDKLDWGRLSSNPNAIELLKEHQYKLDWVRLSANPNAIELLKEHQDKINWYLLSSNPNAIELLKENKDKINWSELSSNPNAIKLLKENKDKINWYLLSSNPNAIEFLKENKSKIDWHNLSANPNAIELLKENKNKIVWYNLSRNPNDKAIELLKENQDKIDWKYLSKNPNYKAIELLKENPDKIIWYLLCINPNAIHLLEQNQDKICWIHLPKNPNAIHLLKKLLKYGFFNKVCWYELSSNPNAIELLVENLDKINWYGLSSNPNIIEILNKIILLNSS